VLYPLPVLIVVIGIGRTVIAERRRAALEDDDA
jgi:cytochrome c-type biogenesis protein CcmH/NrfF